MSGCNCGCNHNQYRYRCGYYGFLNFIGDVIMTCLTAGLWLIWIFVREMRRR